MSKRKMTSFKGLPKDIFAFFRELADNNEKPWFEENKPRSQGKNFQASTQSKMPPQ